VTEYLAIELNRILKKTVHDPRSINEVLISRSNADIVNINVAYANRFQTTLKSAIESRISGSERKLLSQLSNGVRSDNSSPIDQSLVDSDVVALYNAGRGSDDNVFINIFAARSYNHLKLVFSKYSTQYGRAIETVITSAFGGDFAIILLDIVEYSNSKIGYLAKQLFLSMDGPGTRDHSLIRLIISRCEIDLGDIKTEYQRRYGRSLADAVSSETSRYYRKSLLALVA